jgi:hypothetical protein
MLQSVKLLFRIFTKKKMLERIKRPLSFRRLLFLGMGLFIGISSFKQGEIIGILAGTYFFLMGLFTLGCADNCGIPAQHFSTNKEGNTEEIEYEEVK